MKKEPSGQPSQPEGSEEIPSKDILNFCSKALLSVFIKDKVTQFIKITIKHTDSGDDYQLLFSKLPAAPKAVQSKEEGEQLFRSVKAAKRKPPPQKILFFRIKGKKYLGYMYHSGEFACSDEGDWTCIFKNIEDIEWLEEYAAQTASPVSTQTDAVAFMKWAFENKDYQWTGESWDEDTGHDFFNELSHAELYEIFKEQSPISNSVSTQVQGVSEEELNQLSNKWAVDNADETFATNSALNKGFKAGFKAVFSKK